MTRPGPTEQGQRLERNPKLRLTPILLGFHLSLCCMGASPRSLWWSHAKGLQKGLGSGDQSNKVCVGERCTDAWGQPEAGRVMCRTGVQGDGRLCSLHVTADEEYISRLVHKIRATVARAPGEVRLQRSPRKPAAASVFVPERKSTALLHG
ncbi:hypothetical protein E2C01_067314 [Portunus trituberculatus]|uniref:Uncharacterized protein n=1 Tax=Portunus trituberculatus TaxID=210409 RepID=A0A5B7HWC6_PORTR|nr:hypothetical protein [Portunus trituberculatus]